MSLKTEKYVTQIINNFQSKSTNNIKDIMNDMSITFLEKNPTNKQFLLFSSTDCILSFFIRLKGLFIKYRPNDNFKDLVFFANFGLKIDLSEKEKQFLYDLVNNINDTNTSVFKSFILDKLGKYKELLNNHPDQINLTFNDKSKDEKLKFIYKNWRFINSFLLLKEHQNNVELMLDIFEFINTLSEKELGTYFVQELNEYPNKFENVTLYLMSINNMKRIIKLYLDDDYFDEREQEIEEVNNFYHILWRQDIPNPTTRFTLSKIVGI